MIYLSYDNTSSQDGFGAQLQRVLSIYLISKKLNVGYYHVDIVTKEHGFTPIILERFNELIEWNIKEKASIDNVVYIDFFDNTAFESVIKCKHDNTDILFKIKFAHCYIDANESIFDSHIFPKFSWIVDKSCPDIFKVAIHIRRGDVSQTQNSIRFIPFGFYVTCLENICKLLKDRNYEITIYSENSLLGEIVRHKDSLEGINGLKFNIDGSVTDTFKEMVNSDILITSKSSFSYSASLLKLKHNGMVFYPSFWHTYPPKYICIDNPNNILEYKIDS